MDNLRAILAAQSGLQTRLGRIFAAMTVEEKIECIRMDVLACEAELHEALDETTWKPWTHGEKTIDRDKFIGELVDAMHFLMNLFLTVEATSDEIYTRYMEKNMRNHARQDNAYTGDRCTYCTGELDRHGSRPLKSAVIPGKFCSVECRRKAAHICMIPGCACDGLAHP
jgi:hypothetical protein